MDEIAAIEARAKKLNLPMAYVCNWAGVPNSTWSKWKKGLFGPTKKNWDAITDAIADLERRLRR
ncbi:MAG: hypothetical protein F8N15_01220 [Methanobacterium sp.]|nr:hypothetical protein [Methanobacterium sp.]